MPSTKIQQADWSFLLTEAPPIVWRNRWSHFAEKLGLPYSPGTLANLDAQGKGPDRVTHGPGVGYTREALHTSPRYSDKGGGFVSGLICPNQLRRFLLKCFGSTWRRIAMFPLKFLFFLFQHRQYLQRHHSPLAVIQMTPIQVEAYDEAYQRTLTVPLAETRLNARSTYVESNTS
jgi:hypothetical protein